VRESEGVRARRMEKHIFWQRLEEERPPAVESTDRFKGREGGCFHLRLCVACSDAFQKVNEDGNNIKLSGTCLEPKLIR